MKIKNLIIFMLLILLFIESYFLGLYFNKNNVVYEKNNVNSKNLMIYGDNELVQSQMKYIPEEYINSFNQTNGAIYVIDYSNNVVGSYYNLTNAIILDEEYYEDSFLHEFGHFVDDYNSFSIRADFIECFKSECYLFDSYFQTSESEYFAECFKIYYEGGNLPKKTDLWFNKNMK